MALHFVGLWAHSLITTVILRAVFNVQKDVSSSSQEDVDPSQPSPISTIPPEILLKIFFLLADDSEEPTIGKRRRDNLITTSHVCRIWRAIALDSGALWVSKINWTTTGPIASLEQAIKRTKDAKLDFEATVNLHGWMHWLPRNAKLLADVAPERIRSINLAFKGYKFGTPPLEEIARQFRGPFPELQVLSLKTESIRVNQVDLARLDDWRLLDAQPQCLRVLRLARFSPDFDNLAIFRNLRELSVCDLRANPPHIAKWLNVLRVMPLLKDLTIKGSIHPETPSTVTPSPVFLPNLTTLSLAGQLGNKAGIDTILSYIETPHGCNLYFAGGGFNQTSAEFNNAGLAAWFGRWNDEDYQTQSLHACLDPQRIIMHNQSGQAPWPGLWFRISLVEPSNVRQVTSSLLSVLNKAVAHTEHLTLWTPPASQSVVPSDQTFLSLFRTLKTLCIAVRGRGQASLDERDSREFLAAAVGPLMSGNVICWAELRNILPTLDEITVSKNRRVCLRCSVPTTPHH